MVIVAAAVENYSQALLAARNKDTTLVALKKEAREILTALLIQLASSVTTTANGNKAMLLSSGFDLAKQGEFTPVGKPEYILLTDGVNSGELSVKIPSAINVRGYVHEYTPDPLTSDSVWIQVPSTSSKHTFKSLTKEKRYWCRSAVIGSYGQLVYSDVISRVVQ